MEPQKVNCATPGCAHLILPETATRTGGLCMRCVGKRAEAERQEYIRRNRREVNPYAGLTDPVDLIRAYHTPRKFDALIDYAQPPQPIEQLYGALSGKQVSKLIDLALDTTDANLAEDIGRYLALWTDHDLSRLQAAWVEAAEFWPPVIFRGSPAAVRDDIIAWLERAGPGYDDQPGVNHALAALAWIGDEVTQRKLMAWERQPPVWRDGLHVGPASYADTAGWELRDGHRRDLFYSDCWAIATAPAGAPSDTSVRTFAPSPSGACPVCQGPLIHLIELDLKDPRFAFIQIDGPVLPVLTCEECTYHMDPIFARIGPTGTATWHEANATPDVAPQRSVSENSHPWRLHACQLVRRRPREAVEDGSPMNGSQIGGLPGWVQDSAYPKCPDCGETMRFIAQLDNSHFPGWEGVHYVLLCAPCHVTATGYQQT